MARATPVHRAARESAAAPLEHYRKKRDFAQTAEPRGRATTVTRHQASDELSFVIQKHAARSLHYDFRLELDGVLKSWAVPKGPSRDPKLKRLAVQVEDHPLDYGSFEGDIPAGHYGAGHVAIWDAGTWQAHGDPRQGLATGHLHFTLDGTYLRGEWVLIRTGTANQWLLRKLDDAYGVAGDDASNYQPGRQPAQASPAGNKPAPAKAAKPNAGPGVRRAMPDMIEPQLATLADAAPTQDGWIYEVKYDGYRMLCKMRGSEVNLISREGKDWTARLLPLAQALAGLDLGSGWLDGEVVVFDDTGKSSFQALQNALDSASAGPHYVAFDLPYWNGKDLRQLALHERQDQLAGLLSALPKDAPVSFTDRLALDDPDHAQAALEQACQLGLEGLIAKRRDAPYESTRSKNWLKLKCRPRQEFVVGGYTSPSGTRKHLGALLVGVQDKGALRYAGRIGTGFNTDTLQNLHRRLRLLAADHSPFSGDTATPRPRASPAQKSHVHWVEPKMVIEAGFSGWTADGLLRQASFLGIRQDKPATAVHRETTMPIAQQHHGAHRRSTDQDKVARVRISHPDRLVFRNPDIEKVTLARYYEAVAPHLLPHVKNRRLAFLRCPQGIEDPCFFQKHIQEGLPAGLKRDGEHILVGSAQGLVELAQLGVIELHTWGSRLPKPDTPDRITLDLDPGPDVSWPMLVQAAQLIATLLHELGLQAFLKTTGGKGLHIVTPIVRTLDWDTAKSFSRAMAQHLARLMPDRFTANMSKARRVGRIYIDYLRNGDNATAIAAFAVRARKGAPVSMPIHWDELSARRDLREAAFNIQNVPKLLENSDDPWASYERAAQRVTHAMLAQMEVPGAA